MAEPSIQAARWTSTERRGVYLWLAGLFARELTAAALACYRQPQGNALLDDLATVDELAPLVRAQRDLVELESAQLEREAGRLAGAYAWLFLGVAGPRSAPPYASVYTSPRGLVFQEASTQAAAELQRLDLHVAERFREPPDHLAVLLSVMADLAGCAPAAVQGEFLERHLTPWIGPFAHACVLGDRHGFYATAATCLDRFIAADQRALRAQA